MPEVGPTRWPLVPPTPASFEGAFGPRSLADHETTRAKEYETYCSNDRPDAGQY